MFISVDQIIILRAIHEEGSLTRASEKVFKAKSALNYSIKTLEEQLGFKVIDKSQYRLKLTPKGEEFLFKSKKLLSEYDNLIQNSKQIFSGVEMKLSISGSGVCSLDKLYKTIKNTMLKYPSTEITLTREILSGEKLLENGEVDLALFENLNNKQDYDYKKLYSFKLPLVIGCDHEFLKLKKKDQTLEKLKRIPHIIQKSTLQTNSDSRSVDNDSLNWSVTDTLSKSELIKAGLGWGRLPNHLISSELKNKKLIHLAHLDTNPSMVAYLCRKKNKDHGAVSNFIWDSL
jgi:DNA-binding transcriptional LysR family regulator